MENPIDLKEKNDTSFLIHTTFSTLLTIQQKLNQEVALKEISNNCI